MTGIKKSVLWVVVLAAVALAGVKMVSGAADDKESPTMTFSWEAPASGAPVVFYEVEIRVGGMNSESIEELQTETTSIILEVDELAPDVMPRLYEVRVRGVDAQDRKGPWSIWSVAEFLEPEMEDL